MANAVTLSGRDVALLRLLSWTPATTPLLLRASIGFDGGPFLDERRLRERLQVLSRARFVHTWSSAHAGGGLQNYYKLTPEGFAVLYGAEAQLPLRAFFAEISPALFDHTLALAEVIVETLRAAHTHRITVDRFYRENELKFSIGDGHVQPDCFFRFSSAGKFFNVAFEIDMSTEPLDSHSDRSLRHKLQTYDAYQESVLAQWFANGKSWERPRFRVVFLTKSIDRAYHILALAGKLAVNKCRRLVYAATREAFVTEQDPLRAAILLDHDGKWQSLVDLHPTAPASRYPVRLPQPVESLLPV